MYACARDETTSKSFCPPVFDTVESRSGGWWLLSTWSATTRRSGEPTAKVRIQVRRGRRTATLLDYGSIHCSAMTAAGRKSKIFVGSNAISSLNRALAGVLS